MKAEPIPYQAEPLRLHDRKVARERQLFRAIVVTLVVVPATIAGWAGLKRYQQHREMRQSRLVVELVDSAIAGDLETVRRLLKEGADPNRHRGTGSWIRSGPHRRQYEWTAFVAVAANEHPESAVAIAKLLIEHGADVNLPGDENRTALAYAIMSGKEDLALYLLCAGARHDRVTAPSAVPLSSSTAYISPLHLAVRNPTILKALLARGADVDARTSLGETPLHWAASRCSRQPEALDAVKALVAASADVNATDRNGNTPLSLVEWSPPRLLAAGAVNTDQGNLESEARKLNDQRTDAEKQAATLLRKAGAKP